MSDQFSVQAENARKFFKAGKEGVLSTMSLDVPGYPFGSVTPYVLDSQCRPVILISGLAQHTQNIDTDNKVSLTVISSATEGDIQSNSRLTYIGDARKITDEESAVKGAYLRKFPHAARYFEAHDFYFYVIELVRARYIEGFGKIFWVEKDDLLLENIFSDEEERHVLDHMNEDHQHALVKYCKNYKIDVPQEKYMMTGIDSEGFNINAGKHMMRVNFEQHLVDPSQARTALVELAKACD